MRKIVKRVNTPLVASIVMTDMTDSINNWIAQIDVAGRHVDFGT